MSNRCWLALLACVWLLSTSIGHREVAAHEHSRHAFQQARRAAESQSKAQSINVADRGTCGDTCQLTIELVDAQSNAPLPGLIRIHDVAEGKTLKVAELIDRELNWHVCPGKTTIVVPQASYRLEALHGLETELAEQAVDLSGKDKAEVRLELKRFFHAAARNLRAGNTHLHLMKLTHAEAVRYLEEVPAADGLELVYLSYLRRVPDERHYISNDIVQDSLPGGALERLSQRGVLLRPGEEHRNNFSGYGEGYGHVMFLDIQKLIRPVSIGPGIMKSGTDGIPLQRGIKEARKDGAAVVWCHNKYGLEDIPNWMAGFLNAQNIFDGGVHGSYSDTYYRYLNIGLRVPFSTGTDWFIYDFSRVYVPVEGPLTSRKWLDALSAGKSFITNGPLLELQVGEHRPGDTVTLATAGSLPIRAHAWGRSDFRGLELIHNGAVVRRVSSKVAAGHFVAELEAGLPINEPGWVALRIPLDAGVNDFGKPLYAHTSPIYIQLAGAQIFRREVADELLAEMRQSMDTIKAQAKFDSPEETEAVLDVYRQGLDALQKRIDDAAVGILRGSR